MRGFQGGGGIAVGDVCDMVVPTPSRCLLSGVVYRDIVLCNSVKKNTYFDDHDLLNLSFYLVLPHTDSYFKRLFNFTPAEKTKSFFLPSIPHCLCKMASK